MKYIQLLLLLLLTGFTLITRGQENERLKLLFMGDIMQHGQQVAAAHDELSNTYNYHPNYDYIKHIIKSADLAIANLELTLAGPPYTGYPQFSAPDDLAIALKEAGIDFLVTANNHSLDRHSKGLIRTIEVLDRLTIPHTGTFKDSTSKAKSYPHFIQKNNFKIAVLNYTYGTNGIKVRPPVIVNYIEEAAILRDIKQAKAGNPDAIIVFTHWGYEYKNLPNQDQKRLTDLFLKNGVQLVIGSHPHVLQPVELRSDSALVAYSLGNYISNMRKRYQDGGMMLEVELSKDSSGTRIERAGYYLTWVHRTLSPKTQFHILPTLAYALDTTLLKAKAHRTALNTFVSDSRELLEAHNQGVGEIRNFPELSHPKYSYGLSGEMIPFEPWIWKQVAQREPELERLEEDPETLRKSDVNKPNVLYYRVQVRASSANIRPENIPERYKTLLLVDRQSKGLYKFQLGEWTSRREAEEVLRSIRTIPEFADAFIVTRESTAN